MLSRVADALYWMSRYVERAEHAARVLEVTRRMLIDLREVDPSAATDQWRGAERALGLEGVALDAAVFDEHHSGTVASSISRARENARQVREVISTEMWDALNRIYWELLEPAHAGRKRDEMLSDLLFEVVRASHLWSGVADATMGRGEGWLFIRLGQFVERAERLIRLFNERWTALQDDGDEQVWRSGENVAWLTLLRGCGGIEEYRKRYPTHIDPKDIVEFLLLDRTFPRSVRYSLSVSADFTRRLSDLTAGRGHRTQRAFGKLATRVEYTDLSEIIERGPVVFLEGVQKELGRAGMQAQQDYFLH